MYPDHPPSTSTYFAVRTPPAPRAHQRPTAAMGLRSSGDAGACRTLETSHSGSATPARLTLPGQGHLVQLRERLVNAADGAGVVLADRIGREDQNLGALRSIRLQALDAARRRTD